MGVGPTGTVKGTNLPPQNRGGVPPKLVKEFNEAVNRSSTTEAMPAQGQGTAGAARDASEHPADRFAFNDLHQHGQQFVALANYRSHPSSPSGHPMGKQGVPLYQSQGVGSNAGQQVGAPAKPGQPLDLAQMEALNRRVQNFNVARSPVDHQELKDAQKHFQDATDALKAGDYKKAERELRALGFPLPAVGGHGTSHATALSAILLGTPVHAQRGGGWQMDNIRWGARGNQALNDMNGFAANTIMINRLASAPGGVSNPPTEAQVTQYMRDLTNPPKGQPQPTAQQVMQAASDITGGMIMHYSSAGRTDPVYNANPNPHAFYKDRSGQIHEFPSLADARKAAHANNPPIAHGGRITQMIARSPDQWSDVSSQGAPRAGRYIGDCESKVYVQTRLLTEAGFTSLGSVDVQHGNSTGHMFGVFKAPDGTTWVTSNEEFRQVSPSNAKVGVTQADLDATLRTMTAELYHVQPNSKGVIDLSGFKFTSAATAKLTTAGNRPVDSIRRSTELNMMGRTEVLIVPPPPMPAKGHATTAGGVRPQP